MSRHVEVNRTFEIDFLQDSQLTWELVKGCVEGYIEFKCRFVFKFSKEYRITRNAFTLLQY